MASKSPGSEPSPYSPEQFFAQLTAAARTHAPGQSSGSLARQPRPRPQPGQGYSYYAQPQGQWQPIPVGQCAPGSPSSSLGLSQSYPGPNGGWSGEGWSPVSGRAGSAYSSHPAHTPPTSAHSDSSSSRSPRTLPYEQQQQQQQQHSSQSSSPLNLPELSYGASVMRLPPHKRRTLSSPAAGAPSSHPLAITRSAPQPATLTRSGSASTSLVENYKYLRDKGDHSHPYPHFDPAGWPASLPTGTGMNAYSPVTPVAEAEMADDGWIVSPEQRKGGGGYESRIYNQSQGTLSD